MTAELLAANSILQILTIAFILTVWQAIRSLRFHKPTKGNK